MGLDMYLSAKQFAWPHLEDTLYNTIKKLDWPVEIRHAEISACVAYWRKANQIHDWFVQNVQGGVDECQASYVSKDQLIELRDLCVRLLQSKNPEEALQDLPPANGFFFGSDEINEWYWEDLQDTVNQLNPLIESDQALDYEYHASW